MLKQYAVELCFFSFFVDFRSSPQSGVVPSTPLLCSKTLGSKVPGCPQQRIHPRDHEGCCGGCTAFDGHSWCGQEPPRSYRSYLLYLFLMFYVGRSWKKEDKEKDHFKCWWFQHCYLGFWYEQWNRVRSGHGKPGKSWNWLFQFPGLESHGI